MRLKGDMSYLTISFLTTHYTALRPPILLPKNTSLGLFTPQATAHRIKSILKRAVDEDYNLWVLLHQTTDAVLRARQKELDQFGISFIEVGVLVVIQAIGEKATPSEISRRIFREPHSVSALLNRMEKRGLLRKTQDLDRKNLVRVSITEKGQQAYDKSTRRKSIRKIMSSLSEEERQQLRSCLEKLQNKAFKELTVEYKPPPLPQF